MLSRVAERIYWMGRYLERAEISARMIIAYSHFVLDLPRGVRLNWGSLIDVTDSREDFLETFPSITERNVLQFMLTDSDNANSTRSSLRAARENARTTRDRLPEEAWVRLNELHLFFRDNVEQALTRQRYEFLDTIIRRCQQINGLLSATMSRGPAYDFMRLGKNLERADMTTRILDVGAAEMLSRRDTPAKFDNALWVNLLRSLSAYQMYRLHMSRSVNGEDVVVYLLKDAQFPRTVVHCLDVVKQSLGGLPGGDTPMRSVARLRGHVYRTNVPEILPHALHDFVDYLQIRLNKLSESISQQWFTA